MRQDSQGYVVGQRVVGSVGKLLPYGLFVRLDDGTRAYIRRRELTWAGNVDPRELWHEGDKIEAIILKLPDAGQSLELSHRATLPDPWDAFVTEFHQGDVVEGTVKSLMGYGVFVEVRPGVDGLIPWTELATWKIQQPKEAIWVGDTVEAVITHLDRPTKKLKLSIRARMRQLELVTGMMEQFHLFSPVEAITDEPDHNPRDKGNGDTPVDLHFESGIDPLKLERVGRILVVDDHTEVRLPLVEWLQHLGYEVDEAKDAEEAQAKVQQQAYGLLLVDINLPGLDGVAFLRQVRRRGIKGQAAVMSTAERLAERSEEIEEIGVIEAFAKPLDLDEIEHLLTRLGQGEVLPPWQMAPEVVRVKVPKSFQRLANAVRSKASLADQFQAGLKQLVATTPAEAGLIFHLSPISQAVSITAYSGRLSLDKEAIFALGDSPVRDVISEGEQILANQISDQARERFRKLLALLPFESCIGIPIEAGGETHRALFLFHRQAGAFNRYHVRDALAASALFSVAIERQAMAQRFRASNKLLLSGQLARGFSHEVYNKMSGLEIQLRNLQIDCHTFECQSERSVNFGEIRQAADKLLATFNDLKETVELFQQLMRAEQEQAVSINEVVQKTVSLLRPIMREQRISLETELSPDLPGLAGSAIRLQQVFLNIMLNATQHMALKPDGGKLLKVTTACQNKEAARPIKIRFSDTGPGIHRRLWEKIFDLGFTTRLGGTGQGLYIARSLVGSLGGKMVVERSAILLGTTFLVELPMALSQEG